MVDKRKHPNILMFKYGVSTEKIVQIVTERVTPLLSYLKESKDNDTQKEYEISWSLYQIAVSKLYLSIVSKIGPFFLALKHAFTFIDSTGIFEQRLQCAQ